MRDIAITVAVFALIPFIVRQPFIGVLGWAWLGLMQPHRLAWGFATRMPFAEMVAICTLFAWLTTKEKRELPLVPITVVLMLYAFWVTVTTVFATNPHGAWMKWEFLMKTLLFVFLAMSIMSSKDRVIWFTWVVTASIAFYSVKGGLWALLTGGGGTVFGPRGGMLRDNNNLGVALCMVLPLIRFVQLQTTKVWLRNALWGLMALTVVAILATYSRGGALGLFVTMFFLGLMSRRRVILISLLFAALVAGFAFMPQKWHDRIATIGDYEKDNSANSRLNSWEFAINVANDRVFGAGFKGFTRKNFAEYAPNPLVVFDAHSIYFEVLGEHGYIGLSLFLILAACVLKTGFWVRGRARRKPEEYGWAHDLATMIMVSFCAYGVAGAFLTLAIFEMPYYLAATLASLQWLMMKDPALARRPAAGRNAWQAARPAQALGTAGASRNMLAQRIPRRT